MIIRVTHPMAYAYTIERFDPPHIRGALAKALGEARAAKCEVEIESDCLSGTAIESGRAVARFTLEHAP